MKPPLYLVSLASSLAVASLCSSPTLAQDWQAFKTVMQQGIAGVYLLAGWQASFQRLN